MTASSIIASVHKLSQYPSHFTVVVVTTRWRDGNIVSFAFLCWKRHWWNGLVNGVFNVVDTMTKSAVAITWCDCCCLRREWDMIANFYKATRKWLLLREYTTNEIHIHNFIFKVNVCVESWNLNFWAIMVL